MKTLYSDYEKRLINAIMDRPDWPVEKETINGWMVTERPLVMIQGDLKCRLQSPLDSDGEPLVDGNVYSWNGVIERINIFYETLDIEFSDNVYSFFDCPVFKKHKEEKMEGDIIIKEHHCQLVNNPPIKKINGVLFYLQHCLECDKSEWVPVTDETTEPANQSSGWTDIYTENEEDAKKASDELKKWRPKHREEYWYWNFEFCSPIKTIRTPCHNDFSNIHFGNYFQTKEDCIEWAKKEGLM